jgi:hypothetical protein
MSFLNLNAAERVLLLAACGVLLSQVAAPGFGGSGVTARNPGACLAVTSAWKAGGVKAGERCWLRAATGL